MPDIAYRDYKKRDSGEQNTNITETKRKISNYILKLKFAFSKSVKLNTFCWHFVDITTNWNIIYGITLATTNVRLKLKYNVIVVKLGSLFQKSSTLKCYWLTHITGSWGIDPCFYNIIFKVRKQFKIDLHFFLACI